MQQTDRPIIGVTIGDPAGVGAEIVVKALNRQAVLDASRPLVIGDSTVLHRACEVVGSSAKIRTVATPEAVTGQHGVIEVLDLSNVTAGSLRMGEVSGMCGKAAYDYIRKAVELALGGKIAAMATGPINKESLRTAGIDQIGHTEIIGSLTGTEDPLTMFEVDKMRIFFLTRHVSLRKAIDMIRTDRVIDYLRRCTAALTQLGVERRDIAVAGLNPHCGDGGQFGDEDDREIRPAIEAARKEGLDVHGPIGADSVFHMGVEGRFAAILSLYHDQGHIAAKTYDFYRTVSVTLGMPVLRTSVDHGTAFDVAGTGKADEAG
ncbi:MAG: 4-hydroxythreonine-4-phosphate dehydrogenase PdxA, partial [Spirochaetia bacterium]